MFYNYFFLGIGLSISIYTYFLFRRNKIENKIEEINEEINEEYGFGYILDDYPILTIYIKGNILNKKKINLLQTAYPTGFPEDIYVIISFDEKFTEYIGVVNVEQFKQIKLLLLDSTSEEFNLKNEYFDIRNKFAETQLYLLKLTS